VSYLHRNSDRQLSPAAFEADQPISKDSLYNPLGGDLLDYRRRMTELGPREFVDTVTTTRVVLGVTGSIPASWGVLKDWNYELSYNWGISDARAGTTGQLNKLRLGQALGPSMRDASGTPICVRVPGDPSTQIIYHVMGLPDIPCVPLNLLAPAGAIPRDQLKNVTFDDIGTGTDTVRSYLATASGRVAEL